MEAITNIWFEIDDNNLKVSGKFYEDKNPYTIIFLANSILSQKTYTLTAPDTIPLGQEYKCIIDFDSLKYERCLIDVYFMDVKVPKISAYKFVLEYNAILPENVYELIVNVTGWDNANTFNIKHRFFLDTKIAKGRPVSTVETKIFNEGKHFFFSDKYKTFEEYILANVKTAKIKSNEKIYFLFDIDKNNRITFIDVTVGKLDEEDKLILKKVVESCKDMKLVNAKQDSYRTLMPLDLTKLK